MFKRNLMARRQVLKSALGAVFLSPFLRQRELQAQAQNPKRIILVFTPDSHPPEWWPIVNGSDLEFQEPLEDFAGLEREMLFVRRLDHSWTFDNHHVAGIVQLFTGARFNNNSERYADGPSLDQYLLQNTDLRGDTPRAHLALAVDDGRTDHRHVISYSGSGQPIAAEVDPVRAFRNVFDGISFGAAPPLSPEPEVDAQASTDQKITEVSLAELRYLQRFLGQEERDRLELHVDSLRELQRKIDRVGAGGAGGVSAVGGVCEQPDTSNFRASLNDAARMTRWAEINADIIVNAFTCDVTRAANYQFSFSGGHHEGLLGFGASWHDEVAHVSSTNNVNVGGETMTTRRAFNVFSRFWGAHVAHLARRLAAIPEGDGTMLDNTLIYWGVESGTNHSHNPNDMQYLLIGGRNMGFQLGQFLDVGRTSAHRLHVAVLKAFGADVETFGSADDGRGALAGVVA